MQSVEGLTMAEGRMTESKNEDGLEKDWEDLVKRRNKLEEGKLEG